MSNGEENVSGLRRFAAPILLLLAAALVLFIALPNSNGGLFSNKYSANVNINFFPGAWLSGSPDMEVSSPVVANTGPICFPSINLNLGCVSCSGNSVIATINGPNSDTKSLGAWSTSLAPNIYLLNFGDTHLFPISQGTTTKQTTFSCLPAGTYYGTVTAYNNDGGIAATKSFSFTAG